MKKLLEQKKPAIAKLLLLGFVPLLTVLTEVSHLQSLSALWEFFTQRPGVLLFDLALLATCFCTVLLLVARGWLAALLVGTAAMALSAVEYYKYAVSGTHLQASDLLMTNNMSDVARFGNLSFNPVIVFGGALLLCYVAALWRSGARLDRINPGRRMVKAGVVVAVALAVALNQPTFAAIAGVLGVSSRPAVDPFSQEERFENNQLTASLAVSAVEQLYLSMERRPRQYSQATLEELLAMDPGQPLTLAAEKPNVIIVMSESFADLRTLGLEVPAEVYAPFDRVAAQGFRGSCVVPTFGGYTVKSEFELLFGLPVRGIANAPVPTKLLEDKNSYSAFPQLFQSAGYTSTYIHPFSASFYDRNQAYASCGFSSLTFLEDMPTDIQNFRLYTDDKYALRQVTTAMDSTLGQDFVFLTTMQNHQPYDQEGMAPEEVYLHGIANTTKALEAFTQELAAREEPTLVLFVGDHFPFFGPQDNLYSRLGVNNDTVDQVYKQEYVVWSNYGADLSQLPQEEVSLFYLPHLLYATAGAGEDPFVSAMLGELGQNPVYSPVAGGERPVALLDMLAYDRTLGEGYTD